MSNTLLVRLAGPYGPQSASSLGTPTLFGSEPAAGETFCVVVDLSGESSMLHFCAMGQKDALIASLKNPDLTYHEHSNGALGGSGLTSVLVSKAKSSGN